MDNVDTLLTDDDFSTGFESQVVPAGKYLVKVIKANPRIKLSKAGNRYLNIGMAALETETGARVNSKIIYHTVPFEGTDKNGNSLRRMFVGFFTALGLDKDAVKAVYSALIETAPGADAVRAAQESKQPAEVQLSLRGDPLSLEGRTMMASIKTEEYEGVETNKISSTWAAPAKAE